MEKQRIPSPHPPCFLPGVKEKGQPESVELIGDFRVQKGQEATHIIQAMDLKGKGKRYRVKRAALAHGHIPEGRMEAGEGEHR